MNAKEEKKLGTVDVPDAREDGLIQEERSNGAAAAGDRRPGALGVGGRVERIAPDPLTERLNLFGGDPVAGGRPAELPRVYCTYQAQPNRPTLAHGFVFKTLKLAEQSQVNVYFIRQFCAGRRVTETKEQVLADGGGAREDLAVGGGRLETALRRACGDDRPLEIAGEVGGETMDRMTFGHRRSDAGGAGPSRS